MTFGKMGMRRMMWSINNLLPKGARWVEYLESTGTQYIDTGVQPTNHSTTIKFQASTDTPAGYSGYVAGSFNDNNRRYYPCVVFQRSIFSINSPSNINLFTTPLNFDAHTVGFNVGANGNCFWDGTRVGSISGTLASPLNTLYLFANNNYGIVSAIMYGRIFSCEIKSNSTNAKVRSFAPIAIGTTGYMLDLVTGEYLQYGNKGTGNFVIGPDINAPAI